MNLETELLKVVQGAIKRSNKTSGYDTPATVTRIEDDIAWVHIDGGVDETPVRKTIDAKEGDVVQVRVAGGRAWLTGNASRPPTDDTTAEYAVERSEKAYVIASDASDYAQIANQAATNAVEDARIANSAALRAIDDAASAKQSAEEAKADAQVAHEAADQAQESADRAQADALRANTAANGAVTSLGIVQGVVDDLGKDMDDMQTHVAMMDAIRRPRIFRFPDGRALKFADGKILTFEDPEGEILVPAGLHVVPTGNGYFIVLSNDGMYVYDNESVLVATFGESIQFSSIRPQRIGGEDAYIEYYDSDNDGKADSIRIVGANISSSTGIPTKVSELQNDLNFADTTAVADAKKAGTDAQDDLDAYKTSNNARVSLVENAVSTNAQDLTDYITSNEEALDELQRQVDGAIDTWYYAVDPTTSNEPAVNWTSTAQKESHLRDLYFNTTNGHTFRWAVENNVYKWIQVEDADAIKALADAAKAQDTADNKRRVFVTTPTPPYDIGDLWTGGSTGDIKRCKTPKTSSQSFADADWELASKYTDDTQLEAYKTVVSQTYSTKVEVQQTESSLEAKITSAQTTATEYADGLIEQEVLDRNSAIQQSANSITSTVASTYHKISDFNTFKSANDTAIADAKKAGTDAQADLDDYKDTVDETYATKSSVTQTANSIRQDVDATYTKTTTFNAYKTSNDSAVAAAKKAGDDAQDDLDSYKTTNDTAVANAKKAGDDAQADLDAYKTTVTETYATKSSLTQTASSIRSEVSETYATKTSLSDYATKTDAQGYADDAEANAKADTANKLTSYSTTSQMNTAIQQSASAIEAEITASETATKEYADGLIDQEVLDRNAAIQASADSISSTVSSTYATKSSVPTKTSDLTNDSNYATTTQAQGYADTAEGNAIADTTARLANYSTTAQMNSAITQKANEISQSVSETYQTKSDMSNYSTTTQMNSAITQKANEISTSVSSAYETKTDATSKLNTAKGYTDTSVTNAKAEIKVTTDSISSEVSRKVGNDEVISRINQSAESVKIFASKVDIEGAAVFSQYASKSDLENTKSDIDDKLSALEDDISDVKDNLDLRIVYDWGTTSVTLTAMLMQNGVDIHEEYPASLYGWDKESQNVITSLGTGYTKVIPRADLNYVSAVTVSLESGISREVRLPNGYGLRMPDGKILAITV